ncbi:hypothetical protein [Halorubrum sp. Atlit-26R]|uniref:hypothetical protein n=1 Tax=Halorubrum sp. Atlit-26R TaxID=2282128 RepID=UPI0011C34B1A|nr:hypothetical protein [Halorubrum sp. Atlit-26R]
MTNGDDEKLPIADRSDFGIDVIEAVVGDGGRSPTDEEIRDLGVNPEAPLNRWQDKATTVQTRSRHLSPL